MLPKRPIMNRIPLSDYRNIPIIMPNEIKGNNKEFILPEQKKINKGRKTLILDLDETLVHSSFQPADNIDIVLPVIYLLYNIG